MNSATVAIIRYNDARKAISWLCDVIGFEVFLEVPEKENEIKHARLTLGNNMIMLASLNRNGAFEKNFKTPHLVHGVTQCTSIRVDEPAIIYERVLKAGTKIIQHLESLEFGGETFICEDVESHVWVITNHDPWIKSW